ncbi:high mobility group nucleosome-binding domain-containing protein 5-like [Brassica napus]|uniref:high mobility group nucleosome-binding domain-containing protein 5-like n=1 Tax=Brassica napus TaxID=3708 RepID=UPI00207A67E5|nr:high mobility group nucleosome-binding domain-containing protein 5-like [Brassica napus]
MDEGTYEDLELIDDSDTPYRVVDSWNKILLEPGSKIFWPDLFEMDVRTREQQEQAGGEEGGEEGGEAGGEAGGKAGGEAGGEAGVEVGGEAGSEAAKVEELEQDKIQRESWPFQFGEAETGYASGGRRRDKDGDEEAEMHGDKEGDEEAEKHGDKEGDEEDGDEAEAEKDGDEAEAEKDGEKQIEAEAEKDGEKDGEKQIEAEAEKLMQDTEERFDDDGDEQSTLQIMADTAVRFEKAAAEKAVADKTNEVVDDDDALEKEGEVRVDDALEKEGEVGVDDALEEAALVGVDEMPKRVPKRSHLLRSPFTPN